MSDEVTFQELKSMIQTQEIHLFDVRTPQEINATGKINGSVNIPVDEVRTAFQSSPSDFKLKYGVSLPCKDDKTIIFYCASGNRSLRAYKTVKEMRFQNAHYYPEGYGTFIEKLSEEISFEDLKRMLADEEVKLFDVRTPREIQEHGCIPGSINIPIDIVKEAFSLTENDFTNKYGVIMPKKADTNVVFHCGSGRRSLKAIGIMKELGYKNVRHYPYGFSKFMELLQSA